MNMNLHSLIIGVTSLSLGLGAFALESPDSEYLDELDSRINEMLNRLELVNSPKPKPKSPKTRIALGTDLNPTPYPDSIPATSLDISGTSEDSLTDLESRVENLLSRLSNIEQKQNFQKQKDRSNSTEDYGSSDLFKSISDRTIQDTQPNNEVGDSSGKDEISLESSSTKVLFDDSLAKKDKTQVSANGWDLLMLRELALQNSPSILVKKAEVDVHSNSIPILEFEYFPRLSARAGIDSYAKIAQFQTYSEPKPYNVLSYGFDGRWILYNGHKVRKQINTSRLEVIKSQWELHLEEQRVLKQLISHYFDVLTSKVVQEFIPKIEEICSLRGEIYERQVRSGVLDRMFINTLNRELERLRIERMNSDVELEIALSKMSFLLSVEEGFWANQSIFLAPPDFIFTKEETTGESLLESIGNSDVNLAKSRYDEIKSEDSPTVVVTGNAGFRGRNTLGVDTDGQEAAFGLHFELPITDRILTKRKLSKARLEILKSELQRSVLIKQHNNELSMQRLKLESAQKNKKFQIELLDLQRQKIEDVQSIQSRGMLDRSTILLEQEELLQREMSLEKAKLDCLKEKYLLDLIK